MVGHLPIPYLQWPCCLQKAQLDLLLSRLIITASADAETSDEDGDDAPRARTMTVPNAKTKAWGAEGLRRPLSPSDEDSEEVTSQNNIVLFTNLEFNEIFVRRSQI